MDNGEPLNNTHGKIDSRAHVVRCESAHEGIELCGCWTDTKEEWNFNEDYEERACKAESPEENHDANMKEIGDAKGEAEEYTYHSGPLTIDTEVSRRELFCDRHVCCIAMRSELLI